MSRNAHNANAQIKVLADEALLRSRQAEGADGITQLTGDVLAGPGAGSQAATVVAASGAAGVLPVRSKISMQTSVNPVATSAQLNVANNSMIVAARNAGNTADIGVLTTNALNQVLVGDPVNSTGLVLQGPVLDIEGVTQSTVAPAAGGAAALPATPAQYVSVTVNGVARKVAVY
jgi:hypothetical protein